MSEPVVEIPEERPEEQDEATLLLLFLLLRARVADELRDLAAAWRRGDLTPEAFGGRAEAVLAEAHREAARIGLDLAASQHGTDPHRDPERAAAQLAEAEAERQAAFLARFVADLEGGRYTDPETGARAERQVAARAALYALVLLGTANRAWAAAQPEGVLIDWNLGPCRHCPDCPTLAAGSPYTPASLPTTPGAGATQCRGNCCCWLSTRRGGAGGGGTGFRIPPPEAG